MISEGLCFAARFVWTERNFKFIPNAFQTHRFFCSGRDTIADIQTCSSWFTTGRTVSQNSSIISITCIQLMMTMMTFFFVFSHQFLPPFIFHGPDEVLHLRNRAQEPNGVPKTQSNRMVVYFLYSSHVFLWNHRPALISFVGKSLERVIHPGDELSTLHEMVCCPCSWGFCWYWWLWYIFLSEHFNWCSYWLQQTLLSQHACELIKMMAIWTTSSPLKLLIMICNLFHRRSCQGWTWEAWQCWQCSHRSRPNRSPDLPGTKVDNLFTKNFWMR